MTADGALPLLTRAALAGAGGAGEPAPVRVVHLGLGAFHRAHQAWYTARARDAGDWGIAAFTGRDPAAADLLAAQDGLYTVVERSRAGDTASIVTALVEARDGGDVARLAQLIARPSTAVVTLTITEAGYRLRPDGSLDSADPAVAADLATFTDSWKNAVPVTALGRLVVALAARRDADAGPLAVVPCDNVPDNGAFVRAGIMALAESWDPAIAAWIGENVSFVSTSVDRITPKTTDADIRWVGERTGWLDRAAVVTEPFTGWILCGAFPAGRPDWESAGARFVDDIEPFEQRKLWVLNGVHSLLAYLGLVRGHATVASAIADPVCRAAVEQLWDEAAAHLRHPELDIDDYRAALLARFENPRIEHRLEQIATDGLGKLRVRVAPVALLEREAGRPAAGCAQAVAAWIALRLEGVDLPDAAAADIRNALVAPAGARLPRLLTLMEPALAADPGFLQTVRESTDQFSAHLRGAS